MTSAGRALLWICALVLVLAPALAGAAVASTIPVAWIAWLPVVLALGFSWFFLVPK